MKGLWRFGVAGVTLVLSMLMAHVIDQVFFAPTLFGGEVGLLALYAETAAVGVGLAVLARAREAARGARTSPERPLARRVLHIPAASGRFPFSPREDTAVENLRNSSAS